MKQLGLGLMRLPLTNPSDGRAVDMEKTKVMIDRYMEEGFTYFDTAYVYHGGVSESVFGELVAARYPREAFQVTTKMPTFMIKEAAEYPKIFEEQLARCRVEYFDYYFLHSIGKNVLPTIEAHKGFEFLMQKKKEGKIRHVGFSFHDDAQTLDCILTAHPETELVQLQINYIDWEDEGVQGRKCFEVCQKHGVQVAIMEPLKGGSLVNIPQAAIQLLKTARPDLSVASWGIRYAASLPNVLVVLSGMSNLEQLEDNMSYMKDFAPLSETEQGVLAQTVQTIRDTIAVPCTGCRYCVDDCPQNIAIPEYFSLYNNQGQFGHTVSLQSTFDNITVNRGRPSACIACGRCEAHCPQHLPIIQRLAEVKEVFEK